MGRRFDPETEEKLNIASYSFKLTVVILFFLFTFWRLIQIQLFPSSQIIPDNIFLAVALCIMAYLWLQNRKDFHDLFLVHRDLEESQEQLKQAEIDAIASLARIEEAKDLYTRGHSERVTKIALAIAEDMRFDDAAKEVLTRAGILHDIGKIGIADAVLHKKEKLTDEDWQVIKAHPETGYKVLLPFKFLADEREVILSHHERYDGNGYPRGLKGDAIRPEALVLAVADAFDAMNSKRPYREPLSRQIIIAEMTKGRDKQHASKVVDAFLVLLEKKPELWQS